MGRCCALVLALTVGGLSGCTGDTGGSSTSWLQKIRPFQGVSGPEAVYLDVALVNIPLADTARYRSLWDFVDEQSIGMEKQSILEENGFRVGQTNGTAPGELYELLTTQRTCPNPRRIEMHAGKDERSLDLGPALPKIAFDIPQGEQSKHVELEQAQCCLSVAPFLTEDGRTRLVITPKVKHTNKGFMPWRPKADLSGWTRQFDRPVEEYPALSWEVSLAPGEFVVIGSREDRPGTLGHATFLRPDESCPVKRLLVLRAWRQTEEQFTPTSGAGQPGSAPAPLALQAGWSGSARGVSP
jgi:hypothetical protein